MTGRGGSIVSNGQGTESRDSSGKNTGREAFSLRWEPALEPGRVQAQLRRFPHTALAVGILPEFNWSSQRFAVWAILSRVVMSLGWGGAGESWRRRSRWRVCPPAGAGRVASLTMEKR